MLDIIIGAVVIFLTLAAATILVFYSRSQIQRISRMERTTYRDIIQNRHG